VPSRATAAEGCVSFNVVAVIWTGLDHEPPFVVPENTTKLAPDLITQKARIVPLESCTSDGAEFQPELVRLWSDDQTPFV